MHSKIFKKILIEIRFIFPKKKIKIPKINFFYDIFLINQIDLYNF
jgi:hypothetical protein